MSTIAYLANQFPSCVEPYVWEEINHLRNRGATVIPCSARTAAAGLPPSLEKLSAETLCLQPLDWSLCLRAAGLLLWRIGSLSDLLLRIVAQGREPLLRRAKALLHTWLGVYLALLLRGRGVEHIHVHHGYFASWVAMAAARVLGVSYSMTLHGSDLLLDGVYLDTKIANCSACFTVSEFNARQIERRFPSGAHKVLVRRLGVVPARGATPPPPMAPGGCFVMLSVGRLHPVKDHAFLLEACSWLQFRKVNFLCLIAGDGPEREQLQEQIRALGLQREVKLLGQLPHEEVEALYLLVDLVVLTSKSEGIPLTLMEAMSHGCPVLAPAITGIPELVIDGETGFLYSPGMIEEFVERVEFIQRSGSALGPLRRAAWEHIRAGFDRDTNLRQFADALLQEVSTQAAIQYESPLLQQI
ncbi:MAG TPA: glycosyltransferase [Terriglobales bacterium]|jgi:glycosyltransferase involved in cell wall biosynthesis